MNTELLMVIADAIAGVVLDYDIEIGPRGMVDLSASVLNAVEDHLADNALDIVITDDESNDASQAYDSGYEHGLRTGRLSPIEIYESTLKSAPFVLAGDADPDYEDGFRDGLVDAGE